MDNALLNEIRNEQFEKGRQSRDAEIAALNGKLSQVAVELGKEHTALIDAEREIAALRQQVEQLVGDVKAVSKDYTDARKEIAALREALRQLKADVYGALEIGGPEIIQAIGFTNVQVIRLRLDRAERVLAEGHAK